jgi:hypothetical protein
MGNRNPQFLKEGWRPHGPGKCVCPNCGSICSTNAMARARHVCPPKPEPPRAPPPPGRPNSDG